MTPNDRMELIRIADKRASEDQSVTDVMILAESLTVWIEDRRFPEEAAAP